MELIPIHSTDKTERKEIVVVRLSGLNEYDYGVPHRHEYFELFYFKKGKGTHMIDFKEFEIKSNSIHIVAPGQVHQVKRELDSEGFVYLFELDSLRAAESVNTFLFDHVCYGIEEQNPVYELEEQTIPFLNQLILRMGNEDTSSEFGQLFTQNGIQQLCLECMSLTRDKKQPQVDSVYGRFRKLLFTNYRQMKKVKEYASAMNITEKLLNDEVKKHAGVNASQLIYHQIILEAKRLLLTGMTTKEAAYNLHFDDPSHFSKFFKSQTGMTPSNFKDS